MLESIVLNLIYIIPIIFFVFGLNQGYKFGYAELENLKQLYNLNNCGSNFEHPMNFFILTHIVSMGLIYWTTSFIIIYLLMHLYFFII